MSSKYTDSFEKGLHDLDQKNGQYHEESRSARPREQHRLNR